MRRIYAALFAMLFLLSAVFEGSFAEPSPQPTAIDSFTMVPVASVSPSVMPEESVEAVPKISTKHILLYETNTQKVLYEKSGYSKAYPASTTKIMTCLLAVESGKLDDEVTLGNVVETLGSCMGLSPGEKISLKDLVYGMMMVSGNDAARAIAEYISGTRSEFAVLMNEKAAQLGMKDTHFMNPNGLDNEEHYTTAYDMALLASYALKNETFAQIVSAKTHDIAATNKKRDGYQLETTNRLLKKKSGDSADFTYEFATGIKTGDTNFAGRCLVSSAKREGMELVCVLFGDDPDVVNVNYRFTSAKSLFEWGFSNYKLLNASSLALESSVTAAVTNASASDIERGSLTVNVDFSGAYICDTASKIAEYTANASQISAVTHFDADALVAPIKQGDLVGTVDYIYNGETLFTAQLFASRDVAQGVSGTTSPGYIVDDPPVEDEKSNEWLFWLLAAVLVLVIIIVIRLLTGRKSQLRRHRRISYTRRRRK